MGFLRIFGGRDNGSDNTGSEGSVVNFELMTFMREESEGSQMPQAVAPCYQTLSY